MWGVSLVEQELLILREHMRSLTVFSWVFVAQSLVFCVVFAEHCLSFCPFSFGRCIVCRSSIWVFWLPLWYIQTFRISVFLSRSFISVVFGDHDGDTYSRGFTPRANFIIQAVYNLVNMHWLKHKDDSIYNWHSVKHIIYYIYCCAFTYRRMSK